MQCHSDLQMYRTSKKDLEFVITVDNDSQSKVNYWDAAGKEHSFGTTANSLMMVRVNAARHCVSATKSGARTILKFIWTGDYRKHADFWDYTENSCGAENPNGQMLRARRAERSEPSASSTEL